MGLEALIRRLDLVRAEREGSTGPPSFSLLRWCDEGWLRGGLSVARDLQPDELIGPLSMAIGGPVRALKILDVRDRPEPQLIVLFEGATLEWPVATSRELVRAMNDLLWSRPKARRVAVLGEWEDSLQLWCLSPQHLAALLREPLFSPENRAELEALESSASGGFS